MKTIITLVGILALLTFPVLAMAQGGARMHQEMGYGLSSMGSWPSRLNLSNEQIKKLEAIHEGFLKDTIAIRNDIALKDVELRTLWLQSNPDEAKLLAKEKELNALRGQFQEKATKSLLEARKVLTPEQQANVRTFFMSGDFGFHHGMEWMGSFCPMG